MRCFYLMACLLGVLPAVPAAAGEIPTQSAIRAARDKVFPALVHIQAVSTFFQDGQKKQGVSLGSGVIVDKEGHVVTNYHVVARADKLICTLSNKTQVKAQRIGEDPWTDLAVILIDKADLKGEALPSAELGHSADVEAGDYVLAMGSPLSLSRSLSLGVVSCADRYLPEGAKLPSGEPTGIFNTWIQTDAAINPGNSGGPLVSLDGKVVGINTRAVQLANNIGFAIPADVVRAVSEEIIRSRRVKRSWIGVSLQPLRDMRGGAESELKEGTIIGEVEEGSPASEAGLKVGDVLLKFDREPTTALFAEDLPGVYRRIAAATPGKPVEIVFQRKDEETTATLRPRLLGEARSGQEHLAELGLVLRNITTEDARAGNLPDRTGALVESVLAGGPAGLAGLRKNDVIIELQKAPVASATDFVKAYQKLAPNDRKRLLVRYRRGLTVNPALIRRED